LHVPRCVTDQDCRSRVVTLSVLPRCALLSDRDQLGPHCTVRAIAPDLEIDEFVQVECRELCTRIFWYVAGQDRLDNVVITPQCC
jgi:hypothetical protein